jgi:methyl-accepting chemotaxis protein
MFHQLTLKARIYAMLAAVACLFLAGMFYSSGKIETIRRQDQKLLSRVALLDQARVVQLNFRQQLQALKDTLLRGCNPVLREKYREKFLAYESQVQQGAQDLEGKVQSPELAASIRQFASAHARLGEECREVLRPFQGTRGISFHRAARQIMGKDEPVAALIDQIVAQIGDGTNKAEAENARAVVEEESGIKTASFVGLLGLLICGFLLTRFTGQGNSQLVLDISAQAQALSEGRADLTKRLPAASNGEAAQLTAAFNTFMEALQKMASELARSSQQLAGAGEEISAAARQRAERDRAQSEQADQVTGAMQDVSAAVAMVSENSQKAAAAAQKASENAHHGGKIVEESLSAIRSIADSTRKAGDRVRELGKNSDQIGKILAVIEGIADQTNLLALNAAIEAARAGEQGRGFAVVADEVRKLAEQTTGATKEISAMIQTIQEETKLAVDAMELGSHDVDTGVEKTSAAGQVLREIIDMADQVGNMISEITAAAAQQSSSYGAIQDGLNKMASLALEGSTGTSDAERHCAHINMLAGDLDRIARGFRLGDAQPHLRADSGLRHVSEMPAWHQAQSRETPGKGLARAAGSR